MFKRMLSVILAVMLVFALCTASFSAEKTDSEAPVISFDANTAGWVGTVAVGFHIWSDDPEFVGFDWGSRSQRGADANGDGVWEYDLSSRGLTLNNDYSYFVIFYNITANGTAGQTYNLLFGAECFGDVAYCTGEHIENPVDSSQSTQGAFWRNQNPAIYGPQLTVTSIGNVVGTCIPKTESAASIFEQFLYVNLDNARQFSEKNDQQLIDDVADKLGMYRSEVVKALVDTNTYADWNEADSTLPEQEPDPFDPTAPTETSVPAQPDNNRMHVHTGGSAGVNLAKKGDVILYAATANVPAPVQQISGVVHYDPEKLRLYVDNDGTPGVSSMLTEDDMYTARLKGDPGEISFTFTVNGNIDLADLSEDPVEKQHFDEGDAEGSVIVLPLMFVVFEALSSEGETTITAELTEVIDMNGNREDLSDNGYGISDSTLVMKNQASGDADMDGDLTIMDATRIQRYLAKLEPDENIDKAAADVDGDNDITVMDATRIQRHLARMCELDGTPMKPSLDEYESEPLK